MSIQSAYRTKIQELYDVIGQRGLYVNTNHDIFVGAQDSIKTGTAVNYEFTLLQEGGKAYSSPLLLAALTSLLSHGTMLLTGAYGIGKTTGAEFAGHFFTNTPLDDILQATIQGHPQQTEEKMIARYHTGKLVKDGEEEVLPRKFLQCPVKLIDEINRLDPDKWSILLRLIDTGTATYGDSLLKAVPGPLFATANYTDAGTFDLPPPGLDRFDVAAIVTSPQPWDLEQIYARSDEKLNGSLPTLLEVPKHLAMSQEDFAAVRKEITALPKEDHLDTYVNFVLATIRFSEAASDDIARMTKGNAWANTSIGQHFTDHPSSYTENELSVRTARAWQRYARALAWFAGKEKVDMESLKVMFPYVTWHKLKPSEKATTEFPKCTNDRIGFTRELLKKIDQQWTTIQSEPRLEVYAAAVEALDDNGTNPKELHGVVSAAITKICKWDHPFALTLAKHLESKYNQKVMST